MKHNPLIFSLLAALLLAGCNAGGPSNGEAKDVIYGVYFQDARIIEKQQCELTSWMEEDGQANVWLILDEFEDSGRRGGMLLTE